MPLALSPYATNQWHLFYVLFFGYKDTTFFPFEDESITLFFTLAEQQAGTLHVVFNQIRINPLATSPSPCVVGNACFCNTTLLYCFFLLSFSSTAFLSYFVLVLKTINYHLSPPHFNANHPVVAVFPSCKPIIYSIFTLPFI